MAAKTFAEVSSAGRLVASGLVGLVAAGVALMLGSDLRAPLIGWDAAALTYVGWVWLSTRTMSADATHRHAVREDSTVAASDAILLTAAVASIAAVVLAMLGAQNGGSSEIVVALSAVVLAWLAVHITYMLRYARLYYADQPGGIDFGDTKSPSYADFAYVAFTIGMTYQVSDTTLQTSPMRRTALHQALLSYLFGAVILAGVVNLVAGLGS